MTHVELSLTDSAVVPRPQPVPGSAAGLDRWAEVAADAAEPCVVLDAYALVVAVSPAAAKLTGITDRAAALGRPLRDVMAPLLDFTPARDRLAEHEVERIPPLLAISSGMMARCLLRLADRSGGCPVTLDVIATPLTDGTAVTGSLSFFARI